MYQNLLIAIVIILALIFLLRLYNTVSDKKMSYKSIDKLSKGLADIENVDKETKVVESLNNQIFLLKKEIDNMNKQFKEGSKMAQTRNKAISDKLENIERALFTNGQDYNMIAPIREVREEILNIIDKTVYCKEGLNKIRERNKMIEEKENFEKITHEDIRKLSNTIKEINREIEDHCGHNPF